MKWLRFMFCQHFLCIACATWVHISAYYTTGNVNVVVSLQVWANIWANKRVKIKCDNLPVVGVIRSGKTRNTFQATCARNIWLITAMFIIDIKVIHVPGTSNRAADLITR